MKYLCTFLVVSLSMLVCASPVVGGEHTDPAGFSFTYPDGWVVVQGAANATQGTLPPEIQAWLKKNDVNLNRISVVLVRNGRTDFLENMNVVAERQQIPPNANSVKKLTDGLPQQYRSMGATMEKVDGRVQKLGSNDVIVMDYQVKLPGASTLMKQRQVYIPGGGNTFIVTCTGTVDTFDKYSATFDNILSSFKVPAPVGTPDVNWKQVVFSTTMAGLALVFLIKQVFGKRAA